MEAAFSSAEELKADQPEKDPAAPRRSGGRLDLVSVDRWNRLILSEMKCYINSDLRSTTTPAVCQQLMDYHKWIARKYSELLDAYNTVNSLLGVLKGACFSGRHRTAIVDVDVIPRLVVCGFDGPQSKLATKGALRNNLDN